MERREAGESLTARLAWTAPLAAVAYVLSQGVAGGLLGALSILPPAVRQGGSPGEQLAWALISAIVLAAAVAPLVPRLRGGFIPRWLVLGALLLLVHAVNTAIEISIFTRLGGSTYLVAAGIPSALAFAAVLATVPGERGAPPGLMDSPPPRGLAWPLGLCWLAFPAVYLFFGTVVGPLVVDSYSTQGSVLVLPPTRVILGVQAIRSMFFLLPTVAVMERWTGSRLALWIALGWAHWGLVGLSGLVMPSDIMGAGLRLVHAVEIGADSFAYTGILVLLMAGRLGVPRGPR
jgi:hypothetical protein